MHVQIAVAASSAENVDGLLTVRGIFGGYSLPALPGIMPHTPVVRVAFEAADGTGPRKLEAICRLDGSDNVLASIDTEIEVGTGWGPVTTGDLPLHLVPIEILVPGLYRWSVTLDDQPIASIPIFVEVTSPGARA